MTNHQHAADQHSTDLQRHQQRPGVLVVGAGLGGLALAHGLRGAGFDVTVVERDAHPDARQQGYRISVNEVGWSALRRLLPPDLFDRLDEVRVRDVGSAFTFASASAQALLTIPEGPGGGAPTVRRPALRRLLTEGLDVQWGRRVTALTDEADGVRVDFEDGTTRRVELVVGCDGVRSTVRETLRGTLAGVDPQRAARVPTAEAVGYTSIGGHVDRTPGWDRRLPLNTIGGVQYLGPAGSALFVSFCERDDGTPAVLWGWSRRSRPDDGDWGERTPDVAVRWRAEAAAAMADPAWAAALRDLVSSTPDEAIIEPLVLWTSRIKVGGDLPLHPTGAITLLGDAAHAMPPQRGLGGNSALADAASLATGLAEGAGRPLRDVVGDYEREMFRRAGKAVEESVESAQMFHFRNPVARAARTVGLRIADRRMRSRRSA